MDNKNINKLKTIHDNVNLKQDQYIKYEIENEVGAKLVISQVDNLVTVKLQSKTGKELSTGVFRANPSGGGSGSCLTDVNLENKRLVFYFNDGTSLDCDISELYTRADDISKRLSDETTRATRREDEILFLTASHINDRSNPHNVTKAQVGLGNVDNTSDLDKPISTAQAEALEAGLATKQDNLPEQVSDRYLHTNEETGELE